MIKFYKSSSPLNTEFIFKRWIFSVDCFTGYVIVSAPLFVIAYLYDSAQVFASMGGGVSMYRQVQQETYAKRNSERITFMRELARLMNHTLSNVS